MIATAPADTDGRSGTHGSGPSLVMRGIGALLARRARKEEGQPVDLQRDRRLNDKVTSFLRTPRDVRLTNELVGGLPAVRLSTGGGHRGTVLYLHGGAYTMGSARQALACAGLCRDGGPDVVSPEYRLAPEHPYPAAVDDALAVYRALVDAHGADKVVVLGESAGGGLLLLLLQRARQEALPMPTLAVAAFPWADLSMSGASTRRNLGKDMLSRSALLQDAAWFAGEKDLTDPVVSPLYGSFRGLPRTYIAVGTRDLLLDDARRVAAAMTRDGVDVVLDEWPGAVHAFTALPTREGRRYRRQLRALVHDALPFVSKATT